MPLAHVTGARVDPHVASHGPWLGAGRTDALLDYAVAAGPMVVHGRHEFWDVHDPERCVTIDLEDEPFERLVIEVDDPGRGRRTPSTPPCRRARAAVAAKAAA